MVNGSHLNLKHKYFVNIHSVFSVSIECGCCQYLWRRGAPAHCWQGAVGGWRGLPLHCYCYCLSNIPNSTLFKLILIKRVSSPRSQSNMLRGFKANLESNEYTKHSLTVEEKKREVMNSLQKQLFSTRLWSVDENAIKESDKLIGLLLLWEQNSWSVM